MATSKEMITVHTTINAPVETIWNYWNKPEHIVKWNFASDTWCCPKAENDLRPGGQFTYRMEAKGANMGFDFSATYDKIVPHEFISYTLEDGRKVTISFTVEEDTVLVKESFEAEGTHTDEMQKAGWQAILENFKTYVETNS